MLSLLFCVGGLGALGYAKLGSFHSHGFGQLVPLFAAFGLGVPGALGLLLWCLLYFIPRN